VLTYDFQKDIAPKIRFYVDRGIKARELGDIFTQTPLLFKHPIEDLEARVGYLEGKGFDRRMIAKILKRAPRWMEFSIADIDSRLGFFQECVIRQIFRTKVQKLSR
jgi:hypothetical protein